MRVCVVWPKTECNPHCRGPPCCLCVNWSTYGHPSIHSSLILLSHPLLPSLPPSCIVFFFFPSWGSVLLSQVWLSTAVLKMGGNELMLRLPRGLTTWPWLLFIPLVGTGLTHLGCVATGGSSWGGGWKPGSSWSLKWPRSRLGPPCAYCQQGDTSASNRSSDWWRLLLAVFLWKPFFRRRHTNWKAWSTESSHTRGSLMWIFAKSLFK